jgi:2-iminobutanoate/2-iminopropanoate deaminase
VAIADAAGYGKLEIVDMRCVLADINDYAALNDWWRREFDVVARAAARFTYQEGALPFCAKIEIQAVAARAS